MRAALGDDFLYLLYFQEPGVAEAELDADLRRTLGATLYGLSGDIPRDEYRFFDPSARSFADVTHELPGPLPWLSTADLDAFVESFAHHGTFCRRHQLVSQHRSQPGAARRVRRACRCEQPALFIGAEFDSIFGQTEEAVLATRTAVPNLREPVWIEGLRSLDPAGASPTSVNQALLGLPALVAGLARPSSLTASALVATGRPIDAANATACSTSATLVGLASGSKCSSSPTWR